MINYQQKYLKYKKKYLLLFDKINQNGGAPHISSLKEINLFPVNSSEQKYLDPTHGYVYAQNYIENIIISGSNNPFIYKLITSSFVSN